MATPPTFSAGQVLTSGAMNDVGLWLVLSEDIQVSPAVSEVIVYDAFSADFDNYKIIISGGVGSTNLDLRFNFDGNTAGYYTGAMFHPYGTGSGNAGGIGRNNLAYWDFAGGASTSTIDANFDVSNPFAAKKSGFKTSYSVGNTGGSGLVATGFHDSATSFTDFRIQCSTGTLSGGKICVYGYRK